MMNRLKREMGRKSTLKYFWFAVNYLFGKEVQGSTNLVLFFCTTRTSYKTTPVIILHCRGNVLTELLPNNDWRTRRQFHRLSFGRTRVAQTSSRRAFLHWTLPSTDRRDTRTDTQTDGRDLWSGPLRWAQLSWYMIYIPRFIISDSGNQNH
jgi:hypothetical protein